MDCKDWRYKLQNGGYNEILHRLYPSDPESARTRAIAVVDGLEREFSPVLGIPVTLFSAPGRTELGGNHTDHQGGHVLCGSVNLDVLACACPNNTNTIRILGEKLSPLELPLADLELHPAEHGTTLALVRGMAAQVSQLGYPLSGFDVWLTSSVPMGAGLSSSAAFEVLLGNMFNHYCCHDQLDNLQIAKAGQMTEHHYFGKPCGLMDQLACAVGGAVSIDFARADAPVISKIDYDFSQSGHTLCIVDTGSSHADLSHEYAAITTEMGAVAGFFGKQLLREVSEEDFMASLPALRSACGDRAVLRAKHFFDEDRRAMAQAQALSEGDFSQFLHLVNASGLSSSLLLQNTWATSDSRQQAIPLALAMGQELLDGQGAIRVHGGGFGGTVQAFVPNELLPCFQVGMDALFGSGACRVLYLRPCGGIVME